jgi:hypothetical protein
MKRSKRRSLAAALCLLATGCTALREIPPSQYAAKPERQDIRVETGAGHTYQFERARISGDSLQGYQRLDVEGRFEQYETVPLGLDQIRRMSTRRVDWHRTGIVLGIGAAVTLAAILTRQKSESGPPSDGPCGPRPCP